LNRRFSIIFSTHTVDINTVHLRTAKMTIDHSNSESTPISSSPPVHDYSAGAAVMGTPVPLPPMAPHSAGLLQGWPVSQQSSAYQNLQEGSACGTMAEGLQINNSMFDTWRVPLIPALSEIKTVIKVSLCLPCVAAGQQDDIARMRVGTNGGVSSEIPFSRVAPLILMDVLPCLCCGIPVPFGSCTATIDNRRTLRNHYRIHGSVVQDALSAVCLPCSMIQMTKEMQERGDKPVVMSMQ
jgi:Cys-rich protein (TIGR01571 family)